MFSYLFQISNVRCICSIDSMYNQIGTCQIFLPRVREARDKQMEMRLHVVDLIHEQRPEVKRSEENFVDAWNFFLPKEDHALMMTRA